MDNRVKTVDCGLVGCGWSGVEHYHDLATPPPTPAPLDGREALPRHLDEVAALPDSGERQRLFEAGRATGTVEGWADYTAHEDDPPRHDDEYDALARQLHESIAEGQSIALTAKALRILALPDSGERPGPGDYPEEGPVPSAVQGAWNDAGERDGDWWSCLRGHRDARGLSSVGLAARAGISRTHLWNIETGRKDATVGVAERLAAALGMSLCELLATPTRDAQPAAHVWVGDHGAAAGGNVPLPDAQEDRRIVRQQNPDVPWRDETWQPVAQPAEERLRAALDPELLAEALWAWGFDATGPVVRDEVKGPTDGQRRMARKLAAEYERRLSSTSTATEERE